MNEMKCTPEELRRNLEELYAWYFRKARSHGTDHSELTADEAYEAWKWDEVAKAIEAVYLIAFGGRAAYELWIRTMYRGDREEKICPTCGREYSGPVSYCTKCGARLRPADEPPEATTE